MVLIFVMSILTFSKPEWCIQNDFITDDCRRTLEPGKEKVYILGKFPIIIDGEEKNILLIMCGLLL